MARWTIPTLIQALVDQGTEVELAAMIVQDTWPRTGGDDAYVSPAPVIGDEHSYGAYAAIMWPEVWRGMGATHSLATQAVYAANIIRARPERLSEHFDFAGQTDLVATAAAQRTVSAIRSGLTIEPEQMTDRDGLGELSDQVRQDAARAAVMVDGIVDSLGRA